MVRSADARAGDEGSRGVAAGTITGVGDYARATVTEFGIAFVFAGDLFADGGQSAVAQHFKSAPD